MGIRTAVIDTGPIIHLIEIKGLEVLEIFDHIIIPETVIDELEIKGKFNEKMLPKRISTKIITLDKKIIAHSKKIGAKYKLSGVDSTVLSTAISKKLKLIITDDLELREISQEFGLTPIGSIGIILRAYRENIIDKRTAMGLLDKLYKQSSLFITKELINYSKKAIRDYSKKTKKIKKR